MTSKKTCDECKHYTEATQYDFKDCSYDGACALMEDSNRSDTEIDKCTGWDYDGYRAGVYVGPKFGCIHWAKKESK